MPGRTSAARERDDRERAKRVADRYFDLDSGTERDEKASHLDDGYPEGPPARRRRKPRPAPPAPPPEPPLNDKQAMFAAEYITDFNGTQAAIRAGYSPRSASRIAFDLLKKTQVRRAINDAIKERMERATWTADMVLDRLGKELNADIADLYDDNNNLKPVREWPLIFRTGLVAGVETEHTLNADEDGELVPGRITKLKLSDRKSRIDLIGKHIAVQAWKETKRVETDSPLKRLLNDLQGTSFRPIIDGNATDVTDDRATATPPADVEADPAPEKPARRKLALPAAGSIKPAGVSDEG